MTNLTTPSTTTSDKLKAITDRWMEEVWQQSNFEAIDELHAPNFKDRSNPPDRPPDRAGYKDGIVQLYVAFPDFYAVTGDLVIDAAAGKVAVRWTATGSHNGTFMGVPPTGKQITFQGIEILRIENERIVERWGEWDGIALLQQLGVLSA